jgi:hypothetical protein
LAAVFVVVVAKSAALVAGSAAVAVGSVVVVAESAALVAGSAAVAVGSVAEAADSAKEESSSISCCGFICIARWGGKQGTEEG